MRLGARFSLLSAVFVAEFHCVPCFNLFKSSSFWATLHEYHVRSSLILPVNSPAALALVYVLDGCSAKSRRVRHQINQFNTIKPYLNFRGYNQYCLEDLFFLKMWQRLRRSGSSALLRNNYKNLIQQFE